MELVLSPALRENDFTEPLGGRNDGIPATRNDGICVARNDGTRHHPCA